MFIRSYLILQNTPKIAIMNTTTVFFGEFKMTRVFYMACCAIVTIVFSGCSAREQTAPNTTPLKNGKFQCGNNTNTIDCITEEEIKRLEMWNRIEMQLPLS